MDQELFQITSKMYFATEKSCSKFEFEIMSLARVEKVC